MQHLPPDPGPSGVPLLQPHDDDLDQPVHHVAVNYLGADTNQPHSHLQDAEQAHVAVDDDAMEWEEACLALRLTELLNFIGTQGRGDLWKDLGAARGHRGGGTSTSGSAAASTPAVTRDVELLVRDSYVHQVLDIFTYHHRVYPV